MLEIEKIKNEIEFGELQLSRTLNTENIIKEFKVLNVDNSEYRYYFAGSWISFEKIEDIGWTNDCLEIQNGDKYAIGYVTLSIDRCNDMVSALSICLFPEYIGEGIGKRAFRLVIDYVLKQRGFRKLNFSVISKNGRMLSLIKYFPEIRYVGMRRKNIKCLDGNYYDLVLYEIFKEMCGIKD